MTNPNPQAGFEEHAEYVAVLLQQVTNDGLRMDLRAAIETLVDGLNGDWIGCRMRWSQPVPDDAASLFE